MTEEQLDDIREGARSILDGHDTDADVIRLAQDLCDLVDEAKRRGAVITQMQQAIDYDGDTVPEDEEAERRQMLGTYLRDHA